MEFSDHHSAFNSEHDEVTRSAASRFGCRAMLLLMALLLSVFVILSGATLIGVRQWRQANRLLPNAQLFGIQLGGLSVQEAEWVVQDQYWRNQYITLTDGQRQQTVHAADIGLQLDFDASLNQGTLNQIDSIAAVRQFYSYSGQMAPIWLVDPSLARDYLEQNRAAFALEPIDSELVIEDGRLTVVAGIPGRELNIDATLSGIEGRLLSALDSGQLELATTVIEPVEIVGAEALIEQANSLLIDDLSITLYDPIKDSYQQWELADYIWSSWVSVAAFDTAAGDVQWQIDGARLQAFVAAEAGQIGQGNRYIVEADGIAAVMGVIDAHLAGRSASQAPVRIYHRPTTYTVQAGDTLASIARSVGMPYPWLQDANPGVSTLAIGQVLQIPSPDVFLPYPIIESKRIVVSISDQSMQAFENGLLIWDWTISTGIAESPTSPGIYQIQSHEDVAYAGNWDLWMPNFMGIYQPVPTADFMNGFHGFPTRNGQNLLWTNSLGTPVTYGCVLVANDQIEMLYTWAEQGVVVEIQP